MGQIDPAKERERLAALYKEMSDLELEKVGRDPGALTEWARDALQEEFTRRGIKWKPESRLPKRVADGEILVRLRSYQDRNSAELDKDFLDSERIRSFLYEQQRFEVSDPTLGSEQERFRLLVRSQDLSFAEQQLIQRDERERIPPNPTRPVALRRYLDLTEAIVYKTALESAGIDCFLYDDNLVRLDWFYSNAIGGVKLVVGEDSVAEAEEVLAAAQQNRGDTNST